MNSLPFYKRYAKDLFVGTAGMSLELKGAYGLILDLIYLHNGALPDDAQYIAGQLGTSVRKWNSLRKELIKVGKLYAENEIISNKRADKELIIQRSFRDKQAENRSRPNKNNDLEKPPLPLKTDNRKQITDNKKESFDSKKWFSGEDEATLQAIHPTIDVAAKLSDEGFRAWAFREDPANPMLPASNWFDKQERKRSGAKELAKIVKSNEPANPSQRLQQSRILQ